LNLGQFRWLVSQIKCAGCGKQVEAENVQVLGQQDDLWFLNVYCAGCQTQALVAALVRSGAVASGAEPTEPGPVEVPVTADDMLDMHSFLKTFDSDFRTLLGPEHKKDKAV